MTLNDVLVDVKNKLATIPDIKSLKIGLEIGIGAKDCPFIRIIPSSDTQDGGYRTIEINVVYGFDIKNKDLELMYEKLYTLQESIIKTLQYSQIVGDGVCFYLSTVTDEDRLSNLKSSISKFKIDKMVVQ